MGSEQIVIDIKGEKRLERLLDVLGTPRLITEPAMHRIGTQATTNMAKYPPTLPNQVYRRTHTLERKWAYQVRSNLFSTTAVVGNNTPYAPFVQDETSQADIHAGRWHTVQDEMAEAKKYALDMFQEVIEKEITKHT